MRHVFNVSGFLFFVVVFALALAGPGCAPSTTLHTATPATLGYDSTQSGEEDEILANLPAACDTYRARLVHTPVYTADDTPVRCF